MKKFISVLLTAAVITMLFTGCGGSSTAASDGAGSEAGKAEAGAQEEVSPEADTLGEVTTAATAQEEVTTAAAAQEKAGTEAASAQEESAEPVQCKLLSQTHTDPNGKLVYRQVYYEDGGIASTVSTVNPDGDEYGIAIFDREYDEEGKWTGTKIYDAIGRIDAEESNLDDYKTEENLTSTEVCKYDENGFVVERSNRNGNLIEKSTYNNQGQRILSEAYSEGNLDRTVEYTYNDQGVLVKTVSKADTYEAMNEYTPFGVTSIQTSSQSKSDNGESSDAQELHYDDNGILTSSDWIMNGELFQTRTYELDEYGNILRCSVSDKDGNPGVTIQYEISPVSE